MPSLKKIDEQTWFLIESDPTNPFSGRLYCVTAYPCGSDEEVDVLIFDLFAGPEDVCTSMLEARTEIFHTRVWAVDPSALVESVVTHYASCMNYVYPAELVYEFGGTIHGCKPKIFASPEVVH